MGGVRQLRPGNGLRTGPSGRHRLFLLVLLGLFSAVRCLLSLEGTWAADQEHSRVKKPTHFPQVLEKSQSLSLGHLLLWLELCPLPPPPKSYRGTPVGHAGT